MNPAEKTAVSVEAARQQQHQQAKVTSNNVKASSRNDIIVFVGIILLTILSVVALALKGGK